MQLIQDKRVFLIVSWVSSTKVYSGRNEPSALLIFTRPVLALVQCVQLEMLLENPKRLLI